MSDRDMEQMKDQKLSIIKKQRKILINQITFYLEDHDEKKFISQVKLRRLLFYLLNLSKYSSTESFQIINQNSFLKNWFISTCLTTLIKKQTADMLYSPAQEQSHSKIQTIKYRNFLLKG